MRRLRRRCARIVSAVLLAAAVAVFAPVRLRTSAAAPTSGTQAASVVLSVMASTELEAAFPRIDAAPEYSFADSNLLANSLRLGARVDVFAGAGLQVPNELVRLGTIGRPVEFATTRLVLIVPRRNPGDVRGTSSLARRSVSLALGNPTLSFGAAAQAVLTRLHLGAAALRARDERTPQALVRAVANRTVDAGIVYAPDAAAGGRRVRVLSIPAAGRPAVPIEIAVVRGTRNAAAAADFVAMVRSPRGRAALRAAGFGTP
jgi:molybdate transport system substrate-binding protein